MAGHALRVPDPCSSVQDGCAQSDPDDPLDPLHTANTAKTIAFIIEGDGYCYFGHQGAARNLGCV